MRKGLRIVTAAVLVIPLFLVDVCIFIIESVSNLRRPRSHMLAFFVVSVNLIISILGGLMMIVPFSSTHVMYTHPFNNLSFHFEIQIELVAATALVVAAVECIALALACSALAVVSVLLFIFQFPGLCLVATCCTVISILHVSLLVT